MKKRIFLIILTSIIVLAAVAVGAHKKISKEPLKQEQQQQIEETQAPKPPLYDSTIMAVIQKLRELPVEKGKEDNYKATLEELTKEIWFISGHGDTMAVRMEIVPQSVWDTLKGTDVKMYFDTEDLTNVTIKDSAIILRPTQGKTFEYTSSMTGDPNECDDYQETSYEYYGRDNTTNQWKIYSTSNMGTAATANFLYIDCQTGKVNNTLDGEAVLSPDKSKLCEFYQNYHDGYNYIAIHQVGGENMYYIHIDDVLQANQGEWINDSTLKIKVEYSDNFGPANSQFDECAQALFYRILHIKPFKVNKPKP